MRKIKEVLRLTWGCGLSHRQIAKSCGIARPTVAEYVRRAQLAGLSWPLPEGLGEAQLERLLFPPPSSLPAEAHLVPEWSEVHRELKHKGVTLSLLWQEYKAVHPEGYQYSAFCQHYRAWQSKLDVVMRQTHRAGEKMFVDYAGQTAGVVDRYTGELREAQLFVAVLGVSNYTYAEATWTQGLADWIGSHVRAFAYFGAVPELLVPDNLKSGVTSAHRYEPDLNPTYAEMAAHYGVAVLPARTGKPRDKAKAEVGVQIVERWILARLRHHTFFCLPELNAAILALLEALNHKPFKKQPGSRRSLFEQLDRPAMKPLPAESYGYAEWKKVRVHVDYHVAVEGHYYSVPYQLIKQALDVRLTANTVEVFYRGQRVASHSRSSQKGRHTTVPEHMPTAHRESRPVDSSATDPLGREDGAGHRGGNRYDPCFASAPQPRFPLLPRHYASRENLRRGAPRGCMSACQSNPGLQLQEHCFDSQESFGPGAPAIPCILSKAPRASQCPGGALLPLSD